MNELTAIKHHNRTNKLTGTRHATRSTKFRCSDFDRRRYFPPRPVSQNRRQSDIEYAHVPGIDDAGVGREREKERKKERKKERERERVKEGERQRQSERVSTLRTLGRLSSVGRRRWRRAEPRSLTSLHGIAMSRDRLSFYPIINYSPTGH